MEKSEKSEKSEDIGSAKRYIGNRKSKELHHDSCVWAKMISAKNRIYFPSILEAQGSGFRDGCAHCMPDQLQVSRDISQAARSNLVFFKSAVLHQGKGDNWPTYSVLHKTRSFSTSQQVVDYANENNITKIFLIFAGQQYTDFYHCDNEENIEVETAETIDDAHDLWFCRRLTGGDKINNKSEYRVHASDEFTSVAYELYKKYVEADNVNDAIIIDVLNTKYNWEKLPANKEEVRNNMLRIVYDEIYSRINAAVRENINFFICGFSRGALFSLEFADMLHEKDQSIKIKAVVTIDPVIRNLYKERVVPGEKSYGLLEKPFRSDYFQVIESDDGHYYSQLRPRPDLQLCSFFPILEGNSFTINYNVFQRLGIYRPEACKKPIGSAVKGAISPGGSKDVFEQNDRAVNEHTPAMLDKYWTWILDIATNLMGDVMGDVVGDVEGETVCATYLRTDASLELLKDGQQCPSVVNRGETITLRAKLEKIYNNHTAEPASGKKCTFSGTIYGVQYDLIGTAVTGADGVAQLQFTIPNDTPPGFTQFRVCDDLNNYADGKTHIEIPTMISHFSADPTTFEQNTKIYFTTAGETRIRIEIYNSRNMHRKTLTDKVYLPGSWHTLWNGQNASKYVWRYAIKGEYTARLTVYDRSGYQVEKTRVINLTKTQWKP